MFDIRLFDTLCAVNTVTACPALCYEYAAGYLGRLPEMLKLLKMRAKRQGHQEVS